MDDSAVGLVLAIVLVTTFAEFLSGFNAVDRYFRKHSIETNIAALMGLLLRQFLWRGISCSTSIPASTCIDSLHISSSSTWVQRQSLHTLGLMRLLTQVRFSGEKAGTNGLACLLPAYSPGELQIIPVIFIAFANTALLQKDTDLDVHELFLSNFFAQTKALAFW